VKDGDIIGKPLSWISSRLRGDGNSFEPRRREDAKKKGNMTSYGESTGSELERIASIVVDAIFKVHSSLGPGLLESIYTICLAYELGKRGLKVEREVKLPIIYDGVRLEAGLRLDLVVESCIVIESKSVEKLLPVFDAQLLTYLKLTGYSLGFLVNFNVALIKDGIKRVILTSQTPPIVAKKP
jgi:GxxExxY protein